MTASANAKWPAAEVKGPAWHYSMEIRNDKAVVHGASTTEASRKAPRSDRCAAAPKPAALASTAPAPKINTGI